MAYEYHSRPKLLKRMCILSSALLVLSLASLVVGILAIQNSDAKFPFNAGGAIVAGVMALLLAICPMCMFFQDRQTSMTDCFDCCTITLAVWTGIAVLGIPWGFAVSGIYALTECINPSEKTGCTENTDTKIALAVITLILSSVLMILTLVIFFTCCCNASSFGVTLLHSDAYRTSYRGTSAYRQERVRPPAGITPNVIRIASIDQISNVSNDISSFRSYVSDRQNVNEYAPRHTSASRHTSEYVAPPPYTFGTNNDHRFNQDRAAGRTGHESTHLQHGPVSVSATYEDLPPSYDEVMQQMPRVPRETFL